jgi:polyhydroxyalkanoate synthesis regulator phasin
MAASAKKTTTRKRTTTAARKKPAAKKAAPKRAKATRTPARAADRADKSVEAFREALERSFREVVDDAVKRGRMTRDDANEILSKLVTKGRKQTEDLIKEVEKAIEQARKEVESRATKARKEVETRAGKARKQAEARANRARKQAETRATKARKSASKNVGRARKAAIDVADEPLAQADRLRSRAGAPGFPITAYDDLAAPQIKSRIADLSKADARKVRTYEKKNKARKSILDAVEKRLAA